jgi:hypothetical protein
MSTDPIVHLLSQEDQPYGSERRCCNHCGVMIWGASPPLHVDSWSDWRANPNNCGAQLVEPKRPMRAFAEGLLWLDRFREAADWPAPKGLPPLSADEIYALAYARGYFAGQEAILGRFVGCEDLSHDEIWRRFADAIAWSNEPVDRPTVRPEKARGGE